MRSSEFRPLGVQVQETPDFVVDFFGHTIQVKLYLVAVTLTWGNYGHKGLKFLLGKPADTLHELRLLVLAEHLELVLVFPFLFAPPRAPCSTFRLQNLSPSHFLLQHHEFSFQCSELFVVVALRRFNGTLLLTTGRPSSTLCLLLAQSFGLCVAGLKVYSLEPILEGLSHLSSCSVHWVALRVISHSIVPYEPHVVTELVRAVVKPACYPFMHSPHVHGSRNDLWVVRDPEGHWVNRTVEDACMASLQQLLQECLAHAHGFGLLTVELETQRCAAGPSGPR
mmetsp:Transcript_38180/g.73435  ORF Transcript_38180/g.73435 Transcript_38180/m.73435 type:complete len:281 (+) Transcript_38180:391-1233(+)